MKGRSPEDQDFGLPEGVRKEDFMIEMRARYKAASVIDEQYRRAEDDVKFAFVPGNQWSETMLSERGNRPHPEFNKLRQAIKQVTNDQRQNRPQPKVRAVDDSDKELAEIREGLFRSIERQSSADRAYDTAFQFAVAGGYGVWRIITDYVDGGFEQEIQIKEVQNPFAVKFDPAAKEKDRRDGRFAFVEKMVSKQSFKKQWPKADMLGFHGEGLVPTWATYKDENTGEVRIVEYWYKKTVKKTLVLLSDGSTLFADEIAEQAAALEQRGLTVVRERDVETDEVYSVICSGVEPLEKAKRWPGKFIPLVPVWGEIINVDGKDQFFGMVAYAKDAQRSYNYERAIFQEIIAQQPKAPLLATPAMVAGYENDYARLGSRPPPVLFYNHDPLAPGGRPSRSDPPAFPAAFANAAQISSEDIKATTGKFDASLGARSNETSGKAILARQREGDVSSFDYIDNLSYAQRYSYEIINDILAKVYDTERQIRILGADETEKVVAVNQAVRDPITGEWVAINPLDRGRFDMAVTVGPSFTTQRMEAADALMSLSNDPSPLGMIAKYGFLMAADAPGMEDLKAAARKLMVQQGLLEPKEGEQPPAPPPPDPRAEAEARLKAAQAEKYGAEAEQTRMETRFGAEWHMPSQALPAAPPQDMQMFNQPPQGGFFMPQQGPQPAPGGFPGT